MKNPKKLQCTQTANNPTTSPSKKKELLKEAYKYEMVAIDDLLKKLPI